MEDGCEGGVIMMDLEFRLGKEGDEVALGSEKVVRLGVGRSCGFGELSESGY